VNTQFEQTSELQLPYIGGVRRSSQEGLFARRKYNLIGSDIIALAIAIVVGWGLAEILKTQFFPDLPAMGWGRAKEQIPLLFGLPIVYIILASGFRGHYARFKPYWDEFADLLKIVLIAAGMVIIYLYLRKSHFSRLWFVTTWSLVVLLLPLGRLLTKKAMMRAGIWFRSTVVQTSTSPLSSIIPTH
jgi:hypothetical protein